MPHVRQIESGLWSCMSFGGHGVNTTAAGARVLTEALYDESERYRLFDPFTLTWNGGALGSLAAEAVYAWLRLQDRWRERGKHEYQDLLILVNSNILSEIYRR